MVTKPYRIIRLIFENFLIMLEKFDINSIKFDNTRIKENINDYRFFYLFFKN